MVKLYWHILLTKIIFRQAAKLLTWCRVWCHSSVVHLNFPNEFSFIKVIYFSPPVSLFHVLPYLTSVLLFTLTPVISTTAPHICTIHHVNTWKIKMEFNQTEERSSGLWRPSLQKEDKFWLFEIEKKTSHLSCTSSLSWIQWFSLQVYSSFSTINILPCKRTLSERGWINSNLAVNIKALFTLANSKVQRCPQYTFMLLCCFGLTLSSVNVVSCKSKDFQVLLLL